MEKDAIRSHHNNSITTNTTTNNRSGAESTARQTTSSSDFGFHWGNRKRLRCMKVQGKDESATTHDPMNRTTIRRVVRGEKDIYSSVMNKQPSTTTVNNNNSGSKGNGYVNLRQRPSSLSILGSHRVLRNSENSSAMRGQSNGALRRVASPTDRRGYNHHHHDLNANHNNKSGGSSDTAQESKKGGGSSSGSGEAAVTAAVWPPKFVIPLTNKEKQEDFFVFKGSKLPQRPKKRAKFIQRTLNLVSPGAWLCDLTLERYEVREKKISKKKPRGLKAMGNMESDSE